MSSRGTVTSRVTPPGRARTVAAMGARDDDTAGTGRLDAMRRYTRWTLQASAGVVLLPALTLLRGGVALRERIVAPGPLAAGRAPAPPPPPPRGPRPRPRAAP